MLEYLSELDERAPERFKTAREKPRVLLRQPLNPSTQLALYELVRRTALITNSFNVFNVWQELGYSIEQDEFSLWSMPEESCAGWINIKISMILGTELVGPALFAPVGVWPCAVRLDAERLCSEDTQPDSEESSEALD